MESADEPQIIDDPTALMTRLGELHDVRIIALSLAVNAKTAVLVTDDVLFNFEDLFPSYAPLSCEFPFVGVTSFFLDLNLKEGIRIHDATISGFKGRFVLSIVLNLGGNWTDKRLESIIIEFSEFRVSRRREIFTALGL